MGKGVERQVTDRQPTVEARMVRNPGLMRSSSRRLMLCPASKRSVVTQGKFQDLGGNHRRSHVR